MGQKTKKKWLNDSTDIYYLRNKYLSFLYVWKSYIGKMHFSIIYEFLEM